MLTKVIISFRSAPHLAISSHWPHAHTKLSIVGARCQVLNYLEHRTYKDIINPLVTSNELLWASSNPLVKPDSVETTPDAPLLR